MSDHSVWWRVAWRNLWRHRARTLITASGLAFGYLASVMMIGLTDGMAAELVENGTRLLIGQVQVHADDYLPERNMYRTIGGRDGTDVGALLARVEMNPDVSNATARLYGGGLLSSGDETKAGLLLGVAPDREREVSTLLDGLIEGRLPEPNAYEVLVGAEMASQLELAVGDEVVVVAPAADGSMGNDLFTLVGLFETGTPGIDANYAILPLPDLQILMAMDPTRVHEIVMTVERPWHTQAIATAIAGDLEGGDPAVLVRPWMELRPELFEYVSLFDAANLIIVGIIFAMAVFGVANTMLIGTFERRREFAVVRALGTTRGGVGRTVVYEGIILGTLALLAGALITTPLLFWFHNAPPDLSAFTSGFSFGGSQWRPILRVEYSWQGPVYSATALFLTSILAAIYPAWKATRIPPADALADR
ncbi:MAG: ABC transporter permease [Longimicrobiales bacterium]|nr:ABC transporter permease [Longimicrobiales bacterium]